jgi:hypothetical protein
MIVGVIVRYQKTTSCHYVLHVVGVYAPSLMGVTARLPIGGNPI